MEVIKTKDYNKFGFIDANREVYPSHVKRLKKSMKESGYWPHNPIQVDENYNIIDGQNRFYAAKELGIELYFCFVHVDDSYMTKKDSLTKPWGLEDYLHYYIKKGNSNYIRIKDFMTKHDIPMNMTRYLLNLRKDFKAGTVELSYDQVEKADKTMQKVNEIMQITKSTDQKLAIASTQIIRDKRYLHDKMIKNLNKKAYDIKPSSSMHGYIGQLEDVYNYNANYENKIRFRRTVG